MTLEEIKNYELGIKFLKDKKCDNWLNVIIQTNPGIINIEELKVYLTPTDSLQLLRMINTNINQRSISKRHLKAMVQSMKDGTYSSAVSLITIIHIIKENKTELIDGQHTLRSASDADVAILAFIRIITVQTREDAQILLLAASDGKARSLSDKLEFVGTPNYLGLTKSRTTKCGSAAGYILGRLQNKTIDNLSRRVATLVYLKSSLVKTTHFLEFYNSKYSDYILKNASFFSVLVVLIKENEFLARKFIRGIIDNTTLLQSGDPRIYIKKFLEDRDKASGLQKTGGMSLFLNAWNSIIEHISWSDWVSHTDYPKRIINVDLDNLLESLNSHFEKYGPEFI